MIESTLQVPSGGDAVIEVDLYSTGGPTSPVIVYLHGGGWISGSRRDHRERLLAIAGHGLTVASVGYRLATEAPYPAQREDIEAVVTRLAGQGPVFLMGASAGALLAALAAVRNAGRVAGFIGLFGRYDLSPEGARLQPAPDLALPPEVAEAIQTEGGPAMSLEHRLAQLAGVDPYVLDGEVLARLNPLAQLTPDAPPMLLLHGTSDALVSHRHAERLAARAEQLGVPCRVAFVPGANHEGPEFASPEVTGAIADFVRETTQIDTEEKR